MLVVSEIYDFFCHLNEFYVGCQQIFCYTDQSVHVVKDPPECTAYLVDTENLYIPDHIPQSRSRSHGNRATCSRNVHMIYRIRSRMFHRHILQSKYRSTESLALLMCHYA